MTNLSVKGTIRLSIVLLLVAAFIVPVYTPIAAQTNIVQNGSFELPDIGMTKIPTFQVVGPGTGITNWTVESGNVKLVRTLWVAAAGSQSLDLNGTTPGTIFQDLPTTAGKTYRLSFSLAGNPTGAPPAKQMDVLVEGSILGSFTFTTTGKTAQNMGWQRFERDFVAPKATTRIRFQSTTAGGSGPALDDVSVVLVEGPIGPGADCPSGAPFFAETGFCIDNPSIQNYFQARGGVDTFGFPVSRSFRLLGFPAQVFQRHVLRVHPDGVKPLNLLDPDVLPVTTVNGATFPAHDQALANSAPPPTTPDYGNAVLAHLQANVPNSFEGANVQFLQSYLAAGEQAAQQGGFAPLVALEIWGFPTSRPARDPNNANFIYQRFQRGILHSFPDPANPANRVTRGILLADSLKAVIRNDPAMPADLRAQVQTNRFFNQYCPNNPAWVCRPAELSDTDLTSAFEGQKQ